MVGDSSADKLTEALLSDGFGRPVLLLKGPRVERSSAHANELLQADAAGTDLRRFLDETSAKKLDRILDASEGLLHTELQIERPSAAPELASFIVVDLGDGRRLFLGTAGGITYREQTGARLMTMIDELTVALRDVTRQAHTARSLKESLEKLNELRELFVSALAHDLRSPLNAILLTEAALEKTRETATLDDFAEHSRRVERNTRLAIELIDSVVVAGRLDTAEPRLQYERLMLERIAREWMDVNLALAEAGDVVLELQAPDALEVDGDRVRLGEVFANLLANAIRHSPREGHVVVRIDRRDHEVECIVADEGPGVPPTERQHIFDKFAQRGAGRGASGLGLYICRRIVELHGGEIWVEDNVPHGARFVFTLPARQDRTRARRADSSLRISGRS